MNTARVPIRWQRIQPVLNKPLNPIEAARLDAVVAAGQANGLFVILDLHDYGRYDGKIVGSADVPAASLAYVWRQLAVRYRKHPHVIFGLMNEPNKIDAFVWRGIVDTTMRAIRGAGARNLVLVPGTRWSGAHSWLSPPGASNADAFVGFRDPANNFAFEMHQYLDRDSSGTSTACVSNTIGSARLKNATAWLRANNARAFLGEFAASTEPTCLAALEDLLNTMRADSDVWRGWTYWAAGRWWKQYPYSVEPGEGGAEQPQLTVLKRHVLPADAQRASSSR